MFFCYHQIPHFLYIGAVHDSYLLLKKIGSTAPLMINVSMWYIHVFPTHKLSLSHLCQTLCTIICDIKEATLLKLV